MREPPVVNVATTVPVAVETPDKVVSTTAVPVVVRTVVPADDVATIVPLEVMVVLRTVTAVITAVVSTAMVVTVWVTTTVSKVVSGSVKVSVTVLCGPVAVALPKGTVLSSGWMVAEETVGMFVGNGCNGGLPSVSREVMRDCLDQ